MLFGLFGKRDTTPRFAGSELRRIRKLIREDPDLTDDDISDETGADLETIARVRQKTASKGKVKSESELVRDFKLSVLRESLEAGDPELRQAVRAGLVAELSGKPATPPPTAEDKLREATGLIKQVRELASHLEPEPTEYRSDDEPGDELDRLLDLAERLEAVRLRLGRSGDDGAGRLLLDVVREVSRNLAPVLLPVLQGAAKRQPAAGSGHVLSQQPAVMLSVGTTPDAPVLTAPDSQAVAVMAEGNAPENGPAVAGPAQQAQSDPSRMAILAILPLTGTEPEQAAEGLAGAVDYYLAAGQHRVAETLAMLAGATPDQVAQLFGPFMDDAEVGSHLRAIISNPLRLAWLARLQRAFAALLDEREEEQSPAPNPGATVSRNGHEPRAVAGRKTT